MRQFLSKTFTHGILPTVMLLLIGVVFTYEPVTVISQGNAVYLPFVSKAGSTLEPTPTRTTLATPNTTSTQTATSAPDATPTQTATSAPNVTSTRTTIATPNATSTQTATSTPSPGPTSTPGPNPSVSNNLAVSAATYLGGAGSDQASAVDVAPDSTIVLGGSMPGHNPGGVAPTNLLGGGNGVIIRFTRTGQAVLSISRIGSAVQDLEVRDDGSIVVCGDFGVAVLNASADAVLWNANPGAAQRCAIGQDGTVAVLADGSAYVYNAGGSLVKNWSIGGTENDIAVAAAQSSVIVTGYKQVNSTLQIPFIRAWTYDGTSRWTSYDFPDAPGLGADSRGERVAIGRDGKLYFAGTINGGTGASVFSRDPKDINVRLGADRAIQTDQYNTPTNVGSKKITWYGRYNPANGTLEQGQSLLTRLSSGGGNSISVNAITADGAGNVYLAGDAAATIENRNARQVAGITVGPYEIGEAFFLIVRADFRQRFIWTTFTDPSASAGGSPANGVAVRNGVVAIGITLTKGKLITHQAIQSAPGTLSDAYLAVWPVQ